MDEKVESSLRNWNFSEESEGVADSIKQTVLALPVPSATLQRQAAFFKMGLSPKQPKKKPSVSTKIKGNSLPTGEHKKKIINIIMNGATLDFSRIPVPVCSCTGVTRQCYKWGAGGWQSSCCTTTISEYPLPMRPSRPGVRIGGRKMSIGAYSKLVQRLIAEGHDLSNPVDLKNHWAKHGTNQFVTIK